MPTYNDLRLLVFQRAIDQLNNRSLTRNPVPDTIEGIENALRRQEISIQERDKLRKLVSQCFETSEPETYSPPDRELSEQDRAQLHETLDLIHAWQRESWQDREVIDSLLRSRGYELKFERGMMFTAMSGSGWYSPVKGGMSSKIFQTVADLLIGIGKTQSLTAFITDYRKLLADANKSNKELETLRKLREALIEAEKTVEQ